MRSVLAAKLLSWVTTRMVCFNFVLALLKYPLPFGHFTVEIACWLVTKNDLGIVDQCTGNGHRCCWPPLSLFARFKAWSRKPSMSELSKAFVQSPRHYTWLALKQEVFTFSSTVNSVTGNETEGKNKTYTLIAQLCKLVLESVFKLVSSIQISPS